jgi:hypothetical protein
LPGQAFSSSDRTHLEFQVQLAWSSYGQLIELGAFLLVAALAALTTVRIRRRRARARPS